MVTFLQVVWALTGLFFGLLLAVPHSWFPTRSIGTQAAFVCVVVGSLFGMQASYEPAALFASVAAVITLITVVNAAMKASEQPHQADVKHKGRHV